jgi:hypothetical protein
MNVTARFRKNDQIAGRRIAGESFLVPVCGKPVDMENIFVLNPLADFIWQRLDGEHSLEKIIAEIVSAFAVERKQASADTIDFIGQLLANHLVDEVA